MAKARNGDRHIALRLPPALYADLSRIARRGYRTRASVVREAIQRFIDQQDPLDGAKRLEKSLFTHGRHD